MTDLTVRRVAPGESGLEAGLRETPFPAGRRGRKKNQPRGRETPEELDARLTAQAEKFEAKKAKARLAAKRHYQKKRAAREDGPLGKRPAITEAIAALEKERDEIQALIDQLRRYA